MTLRQAERFGSWSEFVAAGRAGGERRGGAARGRIGHGHFWERALSRAQFVKGVGAAGAGLGAGLALPRAAGAQAGPAAPRPIPGGIQPAGPGSPVFHVFLPEPGSEPATITDLLGLVGAAEVQGTGTGTDTATGATTALTFDADMRFMRGVYVGADGQRRQGTFGFL